MLFYNINGAWHVSGAWHLKKAAIFQSFKKIIAVAQAADNDILEVADIAKKKNIADFIFVGNKEKIIKIINEGNYDLKDVGIDNDAQCAVKAVELVKKGIADMPMKGLLATATFMKAVLDKEKGLRSDKLISQITVTDNISGTGLNFITDCAMNISPDLNAKKEILQNAVYFAKKNRL
jgi:phosphate butyryltransferase